MKKEHKEMMKARRRNIALRLAYDGTAYAGFQRQTPPIVAVQNVLEEKLQTIFGDTIELAAAGRTDAGVHAYGQVVNFFTDGTIPVERIARAANSLLPEDIVIKEAWEAGRDFSARHSATSKTYLYRIQTGETPDPMMARYAWYIRRPLDVAAMQSALDLIVGTHDFSAFRAAGGAPMSPVRTMYEAEIHPADDRLLECRIHGSGFLYHMVRNVIGTLANVGLGVLTVDDFARILASRDRKNASATAPARGLYLLDVRYDGQPHVQQKSSTCDKIEASSKQAVDKK
ncbi:tRNA pseudouridine(38-40) synthase TruA [Selenomonas sp.]|uniref:tRNA pseudouridine(38-40) synthase TruA n=1 Tax=Selenomonas sp. TaxID=2053611 RepID=UPI0025E403E9|nr:tRNA pseudouridine(38-40) synthase TruA [Selenomonas sp.]MCI6285245.1 tRNA pseudouridine(38-40) synthase TruA [Selenomonas sp.]